MKKKKKKSDMAPVDSSPASNMAGFELICSLKSNDLIPVHKYKSSNTGLTVVIAEVDGPVVNGYFCLGKKKNKTHAHTYLTLRIRNTKFISNTLSLFFSLIDIVLFFLFL